MTAYMKMFTTQVAIVFQYRVQAYAGAFTQFAFGFMRIFIMIAFYEQTKDLHPMSIDQVVSYIWLTQIFLTMMAWGPDPIVVAMIREGSLAYEMVRPVRLSLQWMMRSLAFRGIMPLMRGIPILVIASLLPPVYRLSFSTEPLQVALALVSVVLAWLLASSLNNTMNILTVYLMSETGLIRLFPIVMLFFSGLILPLPLFPQGMQAAMMLTPFAGIMDTPSRLLMGHLSGNLALGFIGMQILWLAIIMVGNDLLMENKLKTVAVQGG